VALTQQRASAASLPARGAGPRRGVDFVRSSTITRVPQFFDAPLPAPPDIRSTLLLPVAEGHPRRAPHRPARGKNSAAVRVRRGIGSPEFAAMRAATQGRSSSGPDCESAGRHRPVAVGEDCAGRAEKRDSYLHSRRFAAADRRAGRALLLRCEQRVAALLDGLPTGARVASSPKGRTPSRRCRMNLPVLTLLVILSEAKNPRI